MNKEFYVFDAISPLDFRYYGNNEQNFEKLNPYLSEKAFMRYQLKVEAVLTKIFAQYGICSQEIAKEIEQACNKVSPQNIYEEEKRIKHNIRALVNCIRKEVSDKAKPFVHLSATSFDIFDTANSLRFKDFTKAVLLPDLIELEKSLINVAKRESNTLQIGRTHGQHAVPITFGYAIAEYVSRIGERILKIKRDVDNLKGKISGAVGAYNSQGLFFERPDKFEKSVLAHLGLEPATHSTQIVQPEFLLDLIHSTISCMGIIANLADDLRHLQRSEIDEIAEKFDKEQVGSSTMPHKRNPWNFENIKSMWKQVMPRINTIYIDQISEHQRDLSNSASSRFIPEIFAISIDSINRMKRLIDKIIVNKKNMIKNFDISKDFIIAEPLYILLAFYGHPDAHETIRKLISKSYETNLSLKNIVNQDETIKLYIKKLTQKQLEIINNPEQYIGICDKKTIEICQYWEDKISD